MKKELKGVDSNTGVHCPTEELARQVLNIVEEYLPKAYKRSINGRPVFWEENYRENTYYRPISGTYGNIKTSGLEYKIITAEEFIKLNSMKKKEEVYISITKDNVADVARLLEKAGEKVYNKEDCLKGNTNYFEILIKDLDTTHNRWVRAYNNYFCKEGKTEVTIEELSEILGVKREFKVGDRVNVKSGCNVKDTGLGTIRRIDLESPKQPNIAVHFDGTKGNDGYWCYPDGDIKFDVELVTEATQVKEKPQTLKISRENLAKIYAVVCTGWQERLDTILDNTDKFSTEVEIELDTVLEGYGEANSKQIDLLKEFLPLPKVKVTKTVELSRWMNLYKDRLSVGTNGKHCMFYNTKEDAIGTVPFNSNYIDTVEFKSSYTVEEEKDMEYGIELPF